MKHTSLIAGASLTIAAVFALSGRAATPQVSGGSPAFVRLQAATPGTPQTGHSNISGTSIASQFQGGGTGLTGVNADLLDGLDSTAFLQAVPSPLTLTSPNASHVIRGENTNSGSSTAIHGLINGTTGRAVYGEAANLTGSARGVYGSSWGTTGIGVQGESFGSGAHYGGFFKAWNSGAGTGVRGEGGSQGVGVYGTCSSGGGTVYGVFGRANSTSGAGVYGDAPSDQGSTFGGYFTSDSTSGIGVYGLATRGGLTYGVYGQTNSTGGVGIYGQVIPTTGTSIGVWGSSFSPNGWGVYSDGRLGASGTKLFRIDHPLDPTNKWLQHYCAEGPEPQNFYNGVVRTDGKGEAWVQLPDYFAAVNRDFRYTLTVVEDSDTDQFVLAKVARKIAGNRFKIRTNAPNIEVSWEVKAVRNDRWVQAYGAPVEPDKVGREIGKYQHPELYGLPKDMGMNYGPQSQLRPPR